MAYAFRLPAMVSGVLVAAVGTTVLPYFSELLARRDDARCRRVFKSYALALLAGGSALALVLIAFSEPLVELILQRGAFRAEDTQVVAAIQRAYLVQIPGALVGILAYRLLVAQGALGTVACVSTLGVLVSGILAWMLAIRLGATGIALGFSVTTAISAILLVVLALRGFRAHRQEEGGGP